jgi:uncharacterized protein (DUF58 family)
MSIVLIMMALAYSNNLVYFFVFFLISVALTAMNITNMNISRVKIEDLKVLSCFASELNEISVLLVNNSPSQSYDLNVGINKTTNISTVKLQSPQSRSFISIYWQPQNRGFQKAPVVILKSHFPFGLLQSWKLFQSENNVLVYPQRLGQDLFKGNSRADLNNLGVFKDHRSYQPGDSTKKIDWKSFARHQELLIKNLEDNDDAFIDLNWSMVSHIQNDENRISQLALWVDQAEKAGIKYSLNLQGTKIETGLGFQHWQKCMETLAKWESPS